MAEVWSKLVLVHFTTIFAFCHLLSVRGERLLNLKPMFFFMCPLLVCIEYASALGLLSVLYGVSLPMEKPIHKRALRSALCLLFLPVGLDHEYTAVRDPESNFSGRLGPWAKTIGRALVLSVFGAQCIGSIFLTARRIHRGAATQSDQRVLELACGGLVVTLLTVPPLIWQPPRADKEIDQGPEGVEGEGEEDGWVISLLWSWVPWVGGVADRSPTRTADYNRWLCGHWMRGTMSFIVFNIRGAFNLSMGLHEVLLRGFFGDPDEAESLERVALFAAYLLSLMVLGVIFLRWDDSGERPTEFPPWWLGLWQYLMTAVVFALVSLGAALLTIPMLFLESPLLNIPLMCRQWITLVTELRGLAAWPTDRACPVLWEDPIANWFWNLA